MSWNFYLTSQLWLNWACYNIHRSDLKDFNIGPLNNCQKKQLEDLLVKNGDLFAKDGEPPGRTNIIKHQIFTGDAAPIVQRAYKSNPWDKKFIQEEIVKLLQQELIKVLQSP